MVFVLLNKNGWKDGDTLHALVGGIMSKLTGNGFLAGASHPLLMKWCKRS